METNNINWSKKGNPFLGFTEEITNHWIKFGFSFNETKEWLNAGFNHQDYLFCFWIKNILQLDASYILNNCYDMEELRNQFNYWEENRKNEELNQNYYRKNSILCEFCNKITNKELAFFSNEEEDIYYCSEECYSLFSKNNQENIPQTEVKQTTQELVRENENKNLDIWLIKGFTKEQIEAWLNIGLRIDDYDFAIYLGKKYRNIYLNANDLEELRVEFYLKFIYPQKGNKTFQKFLDYWYPTQKDKESLKEIVICIHSKEIFTSESFRLSGIKTKPFNLISTYRLEGKELDLSNYPNLEKISIGGWNLKNVLKKIVLGEKKKLTYFSLDHNKIDSLDLSGCPELEELIFVSNYPLRLQKLFSLEISNFNGIECCLKLRKLDLRSSKLKGKLDFLSNLINLEEIDLSYNNFYGSLEPLKKLTNLKVINIENSTRVKNDIENLPSSLEKLSLNSNNRRIKRKLKNAPVVKNNFSVVVFTTYDYQSWRKDQPTFALASQIEEKEQQIKNLQEELSNHFHCSSEFEKLQNEKKLLENELKELKAKYEEFLNKELNKSLSEKEQQLKRFKSKFNKEEFATETLLEAEDYLASCDISSQRQFYQQSKEKSFERLIKKGFKEREINYICELQREITQLRIQLENLKPKPKLAIEGSKQKNLLLDYPVFSQELAENFSKLLQAKKNFLNAREKTITELQNFFQILEKSFGKHEIVAEIGGAIGNIGGSITNVVTYGIPKIVGEVIKAGVKFSKMKIVKKVNEEFQLSLVENEENELVQLNKSFNDLSNLLKQNLEVSSQFKLNDKLFVSKYQVFDILIKNGIWAGRKLNLDKIETAIISLSENLDLLKAELEQESNQLLEISNQLEEKEFETTIEQLDITKIN